MSALFNETTCPSFGRNAYDFYLRAVVAEDAASKIDTTLCANRPYHKTLLASESGLQVALPLEPMDIVRWSSGADLSMVRARRTCDSRQRQAKLQRFISDEYCLRKEGKQLHIQSALKSFPITSIRHSREGYRAIGLCIRHSGHFQSCLCQLPSLSIDAIELIEATFLCGSSSKAVNAIFE